MLTIVPPPARRMRGKAALDSKKGALRFTECVLSQPSTSSSSTPPGASVAAALTSTSMPPNASTVRPTARMASSSLARSVGNTNALPPSEISCPALSSSSALLATSATLAPASARAIAVALPSPLLAPVTNAALPESAPFPAPLMLCRPPSDVMGTEACHVRRFAASSEALAACPATFPPETGRARGLILQLVAGFEHQAQAVLFREIPVVIFEDLGLGGRVDARGQPVPAEAGEAFVFGPGELQDRVEVGGYGRVFYTSCDRRAEQFSAQMAEA